MVTFLISVYQNNVDNVSGKPTPTVMWYRGDEVLTNRTTVAPASQGGIVRSQVVLVDLGREDLHSELTCRAWNNNKTAPLSSTVHVDMNCELKIFLIQMLSFNGIFTCSKHLFCFSFKKRRWRAYFYFNFPFFIGQVSVQKVIKQRKKLFVLSTFT